MDEIIKIIAVLVGTLSALTAIIKWSIEKYFQKNEEVLRLKEQMTGQAIHSIEKTMDKVGTDLARLSDNMAELEGHLIIYQTKLNDYDVRSSEILKSYISLTAEVRKKLESFENLEMYEKNNVIYFRKKNH